MADTSTNQRGHSAPNVIQASIPELVALARSLMVAGERRVLGITGAPGAGKSTLTAALTAAIPEAALVPMDGFHLANAERRALRQAKGKRPGHARRMGAAGGQDNGDLKHGKTIGRRLNDILQQGWKGRHGYQAVDRVTPRQPRFHDASDGMGAKTGETLNQRTAPPLVCSTLNCRPARA